ncbi:probable G-protein coupled receptor 139 [Mytilus californianus]|uniref:probable G-protein coupled receptor 139 n=1 Tax=Mytilus californianus TaxID=6549 RepID=UPI002245AE3C|nr:probable G-protein coupled receptor 139 [Mytilus californianus]
MQIDNSDGLGAYRNVSNETGMMILIDTYHAELLWIYFSPCVILLGMISSTLSISVLLRRTMRRSTTMFYLTVLSFGDILVVNTGLLRQWIRVAFDTDIRTFGRLNCKIHVFLTYFSLQFTAWILVAVTIDRCISVKLPLKAMYYCTLRRSRFVVVSIAILLIMLNGHLLFTTDFQDEICQFDSFSVSAWPFIDFAVYCFFPFTIMLICNVLIIRTSIKSFKRFSSIKENTLPKNLAYQANSRRQHNRNSNMTAMLLSVNISFLVCTLPVSVYYICETFYMEADPSLMYLLEAISSLLMYLNNAISFFLYCLSGTKFRKELVKMFTRTKKREKTSAGIYTVESVSSIVD